MNENIDLTKILKNCPKGTKLYSLLHGEVSFRGIDEISDYPIMYDFLVTGNIGVSTSTFYLARNGAYSYNYNGDCLLFPSKEQRDWSNFSAPWYKNDKFDPKTLQPFDKVIVRDYIGDSWACNLFSHIQEDSFPYSCILDSNWKYCIPYNEDTKHLVNTTEEAPEYYRYWED